MKKTILFTVLTLMQVFTYASTLHPKKLASVYGHLTEVNAEWKSRIGFLSNENIHFETDLDRIQFHLLQVEKLLRTSGIDGLDKSQLENRLEMLNVLHDYAMNRNFPINTYHSERQPYFIDIYGTHCAVGYLVKMSGFGSVSQEISQTQNYAYVKEIESNELIDWSRKFGFSIDELALIQPTYEPNESYEQIQGGANGDVTVMRTLHNNQTQTQAIYIAGAFTTLNDLPCLSIGTFVDNQLSCLGSGIDGKVVEITREGANVVAYGEFINNGNIYPIAEFNGSVWTFVSIPNRPNSKATAATYRYSLNPIRKVAIDHPTESGKQEIWEFTNASWNLLATVNGTVYTMQSNANEVYAGSFDEFTTNTTPPMVYETKNAIIQDYPNEWITIADHISDTVYSIYDANNMIYFGGAGSTLPNRSNVCLTRFLNGVCQPLVLADSYDFGHAIIWDIESFNTTELLLAGKFSNYNTMAMYFGRNIMSLDMMSNYNQMMSILNKPVRSIARLQNTYLFGGEFTGVTSAPTSLSHLVKLKSSAGIGELNGELGFAISPNPSSGMIQITGHENVKSISISDLQGKKWLENTSATQTIDGSNLPSGVYLVRIESETGSFQTVKWMKN